MEHFARVRRHENLHIFFWLIKDSCWMLEYRWLGTLMIVPTIGIAVWIILISRHHPEVYLNFAVFFWIVANSYWMISEFFFESQHRHLAVIPFGLGILFVTIFYAVRLWGRGSTEAEEI